VHGADSIKTDIRFGWDLAAGFDKAGKPYLVVGMPGRDTVTTTGRCSSTSVRLVESNESGPSGWGLSPLTHIENIGWFRYER
jgi:hypothetical protein